MSSYAIKKGRGNKRWPTRWWTSNGWGPRREATIYDYDSALLMTLMIHDNCQVFKVD
ncbi:MAG: hypothetical protein J6I84_04385 [Bacilli bacterium]|nr:hypothetical protein [Bacilli bacterium]